MTDTAGELAPDDTCDLCLGSRRIAVGPWGSRPPKVTCPQCHGTGRVVPPTAVRSKHGSGRAHLKVGATSGPGWGTACKQILSSVEEIPWDQTAPEDRCARCITIAGEARQQPTRYEERGSTVTHALTDKQLQTTAHAAFEAAYPLNDRPSWESALVRQTWEEVVQAVITAAGPSIAARTLADAADEIERTTFEEQPDETYDEPRQTPAMAYRDSIDWLRNRAAALAPEELKSRFAVPPAEWPPNVRKVAERLIRDGEFFRGGPLTDTAADQFERLSGVELQSERPRGETPFYWLLDKRQAAPILHQIANALDIKEN